MGSGVLWKYGPEVWIFLDLRSYIYLPYISFRDEIITITAREMEFLALSMCSTKEGYQTRIGEKVDAIRRVLPDVLTGRDKPDGDEDEVFEDAQVILDSINRASGSLAGIGKQSRRTEYA